MKPRSTTLHRGADDERDAIRRYLKRLCAKQTTCSAVSTIEQALAWIELRTKRAKSRKGGL